MSLSTFVWHPVSGALKRRGRPDPRLGLTYGQYLPIAAGSGIGGTGNNYGIAGVYAGLTDHTILTDQNAASTATFTPTSGTTYTDKTVYGQIVPPTSHGSDIIFQNCLLRGAPTWSTLGSAIVKADQARSGTGRLILRDCEIWPQTPSYYIDGIRGNRLLIERCWIHDTTDGAVAYATTSQNSGVANFYMYGTVIERLRYMYPDLEHSDGTHNDCVSVVGGKNINLKGNLFYGSSVDLPGSGTNPTHPQIQASGNVNGQGILISNTVSNPLDLSVIIEENWFWGGNSQVAINSNQTCIFRNNRHYRAVFVGSTSSGYWIRYTLRAGNGVAANNSTWVDGPYAGQVLTEPRDKGVTFTA